MVLDWHEQINQCIKKNKLIYGFHATKTEKEYQQLLLVKYMIEQNWDDSVIIKWFRNKDQTYQLNADDLEIMKEVAKKRAWPHSSKYEIYITKSEIKYINDLNEPKDCKKFLLAMLIFCKMNKIKRGAAVCNSSDRAYVYFLSSGMDEYHCKANRSPYFSKFITRLAADKKIYSWSKQTQIHKFTSHRGGTMISVIDTVIEGDWIKWDAKSGYKITSKNFNSKIPKFCNRHIDEFYSICPQCGKKFVKGSKSKTNLCEMCYKIKRKEDNKTLDKRISHHRLKNKQKITENI